MKITDLREKKVECLKTVNIGDIVIVKNKYNFHFKLLVTKMVGVENKISLVEVSEMRHSFNSLAEAISCGVNVDVGYKIGVFEVTEIIKAEKIELVINK